MPVKEVKVTQFVTDDGTIFTDRGAADSHDVELQVRKRFEEFKSVAGYAEKAFTCIFKWELFKAGITGQQNLPLAGAPPQEPPE